MTKGIHVGYLFLCAVCFVLGAQFGFGDRDTPGRLEATTSGPDVSAVSRGIDDSGNAIATKVATVGAATDNATAANPPSHETRDMESPAENLAGESVSEDEKFNSVGYLLEKVGLPRSAYENELREKGASYLGDLENRLIFNRFNEDERMDLIVNYLNNFDRNMSADFFPQILDQALGRSEQAQINAITLVGDSFYDERSQAQADFRKAKIDHLAQFANSASESVRETLVVSLAGAPNTEQFVRMLINQYRNDPSERVRAAALQAESRYRNTAGN